MDRSMAKGIAIALDDMGASIVKTDETHVFLEVEIGSEIDNEQKLQTTKEFFLKLVGLGLKIRKVKQRK